MDKGQRMGWTEDGGRWTKAVVLCLMSFVLPLAAVAGEPTPETETDLPAGLTGALNGVPFPRTVASTTGGEVQLVFPRSLSVKSDADVKNSFFWSVGAVLKALDDKDFTALLSKVGYSLFEGSDLNRQFKVTGFFQKDQVPPTNDFGDQLDAAFGKYLADASDELARVPEDWAGSFELSLTLFNTEIVNLGASADRADLFAVEGAIRVLEGAIYTLKGLELEDDYGKIADVFLHSNLTLASLVVEVPQLFQGVRDETCRDKALASLTTGFDCLIKARDLMARRTSDGVKHVVGYDANNLITLDRENWIVKLALDNLELFKAAFESSAEVPVADFAQLFNEVKPSWMKDTCALSLRPLYTGAYSAAVSPTVDDDGYVWPETVADPTLGGLAPSLTSKDIIHLFETAERKVRWSWDFYRRNAVTMPYLDCIAFHAQPRSIVLTLWGDGKFAYAPTMEEAPQDATLQLFIDGVLTDTVTGGESRPMQSFWIKAAGEHRAEWVYSTADDVITAKTGVRPVASCAFEQPPQSGVQKREIAAADGDLAGWMAAIDDKMPLARIMMPAAHDAGMAEKASEMTGAAAALGKSIACTQSLTIPEQLAAGVRYFDVRPYCDDGAMRTCHVDDSLGGALGETLDSIFGGAAAFVAAHPTETAIFRLSHWRNDGDKATVVNFIKSKCGDALYKSATAENLNAIALGKVRGKIIVVSESTSGLVDPANGIWGYREGASQGGYLNVYDSYADSNDLGTMKADQFGKWAANGGAPETRAFLLSWTLTVQASSVEDLGKINIKSLASTANGNLAAALKEGIVTRGWTRPTFVYLDYVSADLCRTVVNYNWDLAMSGRSDTISGEGAALAADGRTLTVDGRAISRPHYVFMAVQGGYRMKIDPKDADVGKDLAFQTVGDEVTVTVPNTVRGFTYYIQSSASESFKVSTSHRTYGGVTGDGGEKTVRAPAGAAHYRLVVTE